MAVTDPITAGSPRSFTRGGFAPAGLQGGSVGLLVLFLILILIPGYTRIGGFVISPIRLFLLVSILPFAVQIISGQIGRFTWIDKLFLFHAIWMVVALTAVHGTSRIPFALITAVETVGGYFVGRVLIRSAEDYRRLFRFLLVAILVLLPFGILENLTGVKPLMDLFRLVFETPEGGGSAYSRMGLERAYVVFEHPILWGLFCSLTLANWVMIMRKSKVMIAICILLSLYTTMLSLSSAPLLACAMQLGLLSWQWVMKGRWKLFIILAVCGYVAIDMASNRTPLGLLIGTLTFNPMSGYVRMAIFNYGWAAAKASPLFGIGFNDWPRPFWVTRSVDNFWLLTAMRFGIVGAFFLVAAFVLHLVALLRAKVGPEETRALRVGYGIAFVGTAFTLATVHIWGSLLVFVMFYVGAGAWLYVYDQSGNAEPEAAGPDPRQIRYTRFAPRLRHGAQDAVADSDSETLSASSPPHRTTSPSARFTGVAPQR